MPPTHQVTNQPPDLVGYNLFDSDPLLPRLVAAFGGERSMDALRKQGEIAGSAEWFQLGFDANDNPPLLKTHDRFGNRLDRVDFHPSWHRLVEEAVASGLTSSPYEADADPSSHLVRAAGAYLDFQAEQGHGCPVSMTYAAIPVLRRQPDVGQPWLDLATSRAYDPTDGPASGKRGVLLGMGMTEKQGGSDVRTNTSTATPLNGGGPGGEHLITGHKWFFSAPMCDAFLILAQAPGGLSCFFMPRWTPDGERNRMYLQRLKDKVGNRSNASTEVEFEDAHAWMVGEEGKGVRTIIEMVSATRLDCTIGAAATMRQATTQAIWHSAHRRAFGAKLIDKPLMVNVLADLELDVEAATALTARAAVAFDRGPVDEHEALVHRILIPVAKYWVSKICTAVVREAMECLGGAGYVEESVLARLFRESPLNAIWEGSGNVIALDALRAMATHPQSIDALLTEIETGSEEPAIRRAVDEIRSQLRDPAHLESRARLLVEQLAVVAAGSLLAAHRAGPVADSFVRTRVTTPKGSLHGTLPPDIDATAILADARAGLGLG